MQQSEEQSVCAENTGQELNAVARIVNDPAARNEAARELFFLYFDRVERTIQRRLALRGLSYDPASEHYGRVFDFVYRRVFSPGVIAGAVANFDIATGPLAGWLLRRVDFAVRDWLKSVRVDRAAVTSVDPSQLDGTHGAARQAEERADAGVGIDEALHQLSPTQRACTILRILPVRPLRADELSLLEQVSERPREEWESQLREMIGLTPADSTGMREQELLSEIADWMAWQRCQREVSRRLRQALIEETRATERDFNELEQRAQNQTADAIRRDTRSLQERPAKERRHSVLRQQYALCCHELYRCTRRLAELRREYAAARPVTLVSYEQIAAILGKSVASVTTHLHESRVRIERHLKQVKTVP